MLVPRSGSRLISNDNCRVSASCRNGRATMSRRLVNAMSSASTVTVPELDLGEIENVADQVQEVGAGAMDGAGELDLSRREVAVRIVGELLAQDEDAVERRAQLVRHVGEELRLVFRGQRKLGCLLLQRAAGLLDFLILALHLDVSFRQLLRLLLELLVGLLQLPLLGLQFAGELLRLLEQAFGLHRGLDAVDHDADVGGQLLEEHHLQRGELARARRARSRP